MLTILKASAGSGKTYKLTERFIICLLGRKDPGTEQYSLRRSRGAIINRHRHLLAITFTNKATDEMKERIIHELAVLAGMEKGEMVDGREKKPESDYADNLVRLFRCTPEELRDEARSALRQLLFDFNFFNVSTIDSFFQLILRTFAYEAELEGDYEVDLDDQSAIDAGIVSLFASIANNPGAAESQQTVGWITDYLLDQAHKGLPINLFNRSSTLYTHFVKSIMQLNNETFAANSEDLTRYLASSRIGAFRDALLLNLRHIAGEAHRLMADALSAIEANPLPKGNYNANMVKAMRTFLADGNFKAMMDKATIASVAQSGKIAESKGMALFNAGYAPDVYKTIHGACWFCLDNKPLYLTCEAIISNLFALGMMSAVFRHIDMVRAENNTLLLSDTNTLLRRIMADDDAPFIFERVGMRLRHFLIDEFQDTSRLQWENIRPLLNESQAWGHDNLIIGDEKQSIYRFRGSDPSLIGQAVPQQVRPPVAIEGGTAEENTNWRSSADVVRFNNDLFGAIASIYGLDEIYGNVHQKIAKTDRPGYVNVERLEKADFLPRAMERMVSEIKRQLDAGYKPQDITVLCRGNAEAGRLVQFLIEVFATDPDLAERKLRVVSDDAMQIDASPAVRRVVGVLRTLAAPVQTPDNAEGRYRSDEELSNLINHYERLLGMGRTPSEALAEAVGLATEAAELIEGADGRQLRSSSLPPLVQLVVSAIGADTEGEQMFVLAFEDLVSEFCERGNADLRSFLQWWDATGCRSKVTGVSADAVRVMTIHKSKGLEFKCVHLVLPDAEMVKFSDPQWFEPQPIAGVNTDLMPPLVAMVPGAYMEETPFADQYRRIFRESFLDEANVLYVAFTRAIDELIVSYAYQPPSSSSASSTSVKNGEVIFKALARLGSETGNYVVGQPTTPFPDMKKKHRAIDPHSSVMLPLVPATDRPELWDFTGVTTNEEKVFGRKRGNMLHNILADVTTVDTLHKAVSRAAHSGALPFGQSDATERRLREAIGHSPLTASWFAPGVKILSERPLISADGKSTRPDRVIIRPDGAVTVIDYKFGQEHVKSHKEQVKSYMNHYRQMGFRPVTGYVWYVDRNHVVETEN